jgi:hypothetical protein
VEDLDGVPMTTSPSSSNRRDRAKRDIKNKWEVDVSTPALATSKWDNLDQEPDGDEPSRKRSKVKVKEVEDIFVDTDSSIRSRKMLSSEEEMDGGKQPRLVQMLAKEMIIKEQTSKYINLIGMYQLETSSEAVTPQSSDSRSDLKTQKYVSINYNQTLYNS